MSLDKGKLIRYLKGIALPVAIYFILLICTQGRFGNADSIIMCFRQVTYPALIALALAFSMVMGMWDFSAGTVVMVSGMFGGYIATKTGAGILVMCIIAIAIAVVLTILTGILYNLMQVPSIVLTIGLALAFEALPRTFGINQVQVSITLMKLASAPWCFILFGVMFVLFYFIYNHTVLGYDMQAIGANQVIANNAGIDISKTKFLTFVWSGLFRGIAAVLYISFNGSVIAPSSLSSVSLIFNAMMGIFIGFFLAKFLNFSVGVVLGVLCMQMLNSGLVALGAATTVRTITSGVFLLVILIISSNQVVVEELQRRKKVAKWANEEFEKSKVPNV